MLCDQQSGVQQSPTEAARIRSSYNCRPAGVLNAPSRGCVVIITQSVGLLQGSIWVIFFLMKTTVPRTELLEDVEGFASALAKESHTTSSGALRFAAPIDGVWYRLARPVSHHHGHLTEAFRADWNITEAPIVQVNLTTTFPGIIRAWGI